jgi:hypothetical protein
MVQNLVHNFSKIIWFNFFVHHFSKKIWRITFLKSFDLNFFVLTFFKKLFQHFHNIFFIFLRFFFFFFCVGSVCVHRLFGWGRGGPSSHVRARGGWSLSRSLGRLLTGPRKFDMPCLTFPSITQSIAVSRTQKRNFGTHNWNRS